MPCHWSRDAARVPSFYTSPSRYSPGSVRLPKERGAAAGSLKADGHNLRSGAPWARSDEMEKKSMNEGCFIGLDDKIISVNVYRLIM
ncbi:hypothetical protein D3C77_338900 [compost metagenome]